ncbi:MAG: family 10 glycosylhydrolase [Lewinellaceae bacterium]|nr:family 10 glycosylhydrolase [Lewinellaceae bacterium]
MAQPYFKTFLTLALLAAGQTLLPAQDGPAPAVRGVWLTNVASDALYSRENIREAVSLCDELGFNAIFVVTWNDTYTTYPSAQVKAVTGLAIQPDFEGRDPLRELIEAAHEKGIKVFAWFEFGFAATMNDTTGGILIQKNPHWASRDQEGRVTEKNGFQWMNPFHPEVQDFIKGLVLEVVRNYDIDGIQGDDRLPALPSNGGYDEYTVNLYQSEHGGRKPPVHYKDYEWVKWRSGKLSSFLAGLVGEVRKEKPGIIISMAPSIYPWSEENYLQDWPEWMDMGLVDLIIPQVYRYDLDAYQREVDKILTRQLHPHDKGRFFPGVLLQVNDYNPSEELLEGFIAYNRQHGIPGEVFFFFEGIRKFEAYFKERYKDRPPFPSLEELAAFNGQD